MDSIIRIGHPIAFGTLILFSVIEMSISAWLTAMFASKHNALNSNEKARVHYTLFTSIWTILFSAVYLVAFMLKSDNLLASIASHAAFLFLTWILWIAAAAAVTQLIGGVLHCSTQTVFVYCEKLNALEGFAWLIFVVVTLLLIFVLVRGIMSARRGDGYAGALVDI
ncbi:hypothetical protein CPB84DRAFT_1779120 [Gymnopilus junonius]|uniref:MARVEL domain-containing protein n=1 Tax=Gymnopilus junonius TaxID=109634 RepID=A0A9P5NMJ0_GYMJU|nr:hypothetical protein CPB84DRAFT_1779120 [Gymnopilus junonius]